MTEDIRPHQRFGILYLHIKSILIACRANMPWENIELLQLTSVVNIHIDNITYSEVVKLKMSVYDCHTHSLPSPVADTPLVALPIRAPSRLLQQRPSPQPSSFHAALMCTLCQTPSLWLCSPQLLQTLHSHIPVGCGSSDCVCLVSACS